MLLYFFLAFGLLVGPALACLSKMKDPKRIQFEERMNEPIKNVNRAIGMVHQFYDSIAENNQQLASLYQDPKAADYHVPICSEDPFVLQKEKISYWLAVNNHGILENFLRILRGVRPITAVDGTRHRQKIFKNIVRSQFLMFLVYLLKETTEETLKDYIGTLLGYHRLLNTVENSAKTGNFKSQYMTGLEPSHKEDILYITKALNKNIQHMVILLDAHTNYVTTDCVPKSLNMYAFHKLYVYLVNLPVADEKSIRMFIEKILPIHDEVQSANVQIKKDFARRVQEIKDKMDSQFEALSEVQDKSEISVKSTQGKLTGKQQARGKPRTVVNAVPNKEKVAIANVADENANAINKAVTVPTPPIAIEEQIAATKKPEQIADKSSTGDCQASEEKEFSDAPPTAKASTKKLAAEKKAQAMEAKQAKARAAEEKQKAKHAKRVAQIAEINEEDDDDVKFYYTLLSPEANPTFNANQKAQACKVTYNSTDRFQHSIYPEITASGDTINFLCSLMVSGTPDYEGFCAAHADLGGKLVEKKNGNKLFYFDEPIKYHKTLHRPHESSDFDHRLYRRFYRNCGLHPYFFILQKAL